MPRQTPSINYSHRRAPLAMRNFGTKQKQRFVDEYMVDLDAEAAGERAGIGAHGGRFLINQPSIQERVRLVKGRRGYRTEIYADEVLRRWWLLATADVRELQSVWRVACRHCWGIDHQWQFRDNELRDAAQQHRMNQMLMAREDRVEFDDKGGGGYSGNREPCRGPDYVKRYRQMAIQQGYPEPVGLEATSDHDCPACDGHGQVLVIHADSRHLSPAAALLYNGVEISKDGSVRLQIRDRDAAMRMVARHLGMIVNRHAIQVFQPEKMSDEQLDIALQSVDRLIGPSPVAGEVVDGESEGVGE